MTDSNNPGGEERRGEERRGEERRGLTLHYAGDPPRRGGLLCLAVPLRGELRCTTLGIRLGEAGYFV